MHWSFVYGICAIVFLLSSTPAWSLSDHSNSANSKLTKTRPDAREIDTLATHTQSSDSEWTVVLLSDTSAVVVGMPHSLKSRAVLPTADMNPRLKFRWDYESDGVWDTEFAPDSTSSHAWDRPGEVMAMVEARDAGGRSRQSTLSLRVHAELEIDSILTPESVFVLQPAMMTCRATSFKGRIGEYSWDLNGDGSFDTTTSRPGITHTFTDEGMRPVACRIMDEYGRTATAKRSVLVQNAPTVADARGPYSAQVNNPLAIAGEARDPDNRVVSYSWDFDGDGKNDWSSSNNTTVQFTYPRAGSYVARFMVTTDDGRTTESSAAVEVGNQAPKAYAGEDVISKKGRTVFLMGSGHDPDGKIVKYEWDFNGDGRFDWESVDTGYVAQPFDQFSSPVLRVTDADGATGYDTLRVVICPEGMTPVADGRFCIDEYEWPNHSGEIPAGQVSLQEAAEMCAKTGKRLCTGREWESACRGSEKRSSTYPYGNIYNKEACNTLGNSWSRNQVTRSGVLKNCVGINEAYDMSGNLAEWTSDGYGNSSYAYGGSWQSGDKASTCQSRMLFGEDRRYFVVGFRCCK